MPQFDSKFSLGNAITLIVLLITITVGYTKFGAQVEANTQQISDLTKIADTNKEFHIEQRVRLWNRVNELQLVINAQNERIARIEAGDEYIIRQLDKLVDSVEELKKRTIH